MVNIWEQIFKKKILIFHTTHSNFVGVCFFQSLGFAPSKLDRKIGGSWRDYLATKFSVLQSSARVDLYYPSGDAYPSLQYVKLKSTT